MLFTTLKQHRYQGKLRKPGDEYEIPGQTVPTLYKALGWVIEAPPKVFTPIPKPVYQTRAMKATETEVSTDEEVVKPKRSYTRRNLTTE